MGAEEAGGPLRPEELRGADPRLVVGGAGEAGARTRGGPAAWANQRLGSVPAAYRHQGNVSDSSPVAPPPQTYRWEWGTHTKLS